MKANVLNISALFESGGHGAVDLTEALNTHINVDFVPGETSDIKSLVLSDVLNGETLVVDFVETCVPDDPFYVRWINRLGGWEYYMFSSGKRFGTEAQGTDVFVPYSGTLSDAERTRELLALERADFVEMGEEQLDRDTFRLLASIALSPRIDTFNRETGRWEGITLEGKHSFWWNTRSGCGTVNYTFRLIDQNNQF